MGLAVTVHEDTRHACTRALELLCTVMEMRITLQPTQMPGTGRWIGRAVMAPHDNAPTVETGH